MKDFMHALLAFFPLLCIILLIYAAIWKRRMLNHQKEFCKDEVASGRCPILEKEDGSANQN